MAQEPSVTPDSRELDVCREDAVCRDNSNQPVPLSLAKQQSALPPGPPAHQSGVDPSENTFLTPSRGGVRRRTNVH